MFISSLEKKLGCKDSELFDLILEMSIKGEVTVKIDESKGEINIEYS